MAAARTDEKSMLARAARARWARLPRKLGRLGPDGCRGSRAILDQPQGRRQGARRSSCCTIERLTGDDSPGPAQAPGEILPLCSPCSGATSTLGDYPPQAAAARLGASRSPSICGPPLSPTAAPSGPACCVSCVTMLRIVSPSATQLKQPTAGPPFGASAESDGCRTMSLRSGSATAQRRRGWVNSSLARAGEGFVHNQIAGGFKHEHH